MKYNVYCDESCHLEHDDSNAMTIGSIWCSKEKVPEINWRINEIKKGLITIIHDYAVSESIFPRICDTFIQGRL